MSHARNTLIVVAGLASVVPAAAQPAPAPTPLQRLEGAVSRVTRSVNASWGIYAKCLETGEELALDADRQMDTMSTIKIPLMVEVFEQIKAGRFKLTDSYTLRKDELLHGTGVLRSLDPGAVISVKDLITLDRKSVV